MLMSFGTMKRICLLLLLLFFSLRVYGQDWLQSASVIRDYMLPYGSDAVIPLYDKPGGEIISYINNDDMRLKSVIVLDTDEKYCYVTVHDAVTSEHKGTGWISDSTTLIDVLDRAFVSYEYHGEVAIYDRPDGTVLSTPVNDQFKMVGLFFMGKNEEYYKVLAFDSITGDYYGQGWVSRAIPLEAHTRIHSRLYSEGTWTLFSEASLDSEPVVTFYEWVDLFEVLDYECGWLKGRFHSDDQTYVGWIPSLVLCDNPYTTCG